MRRAHESRWVKGAAQGSLEWTGGRMVLYPCILRTRPRTGLVSGTPVLMHLKRHLNVPTHRHRTRPFQGGLTGRISRRFKHATNQMHPIRHRKGGTVPAPQPLESHPRSQGIWETESGPGVCPGPVTSLHSLEPRGATTLLAPGVRRACLCPTSLLRPVAGGLGPCHCVCLGRLAWELRAGGGQITNCNLPS